MTANATTIHYDPSLRAHWPDPLAREWLAKYPQVFDPEDLRLALAQPLYHFKEWVAAIHVLTTTGALSLVEKYLLTSSDRHLHKREVITSVLTSVQLERIRQICAVHPNRPEQDAGVQPPDLFAYLPDGRFWFVEVKGPTERISAKQQASHARITRELGVPVEVVRVCPAAQSAA